MLTAQDFNAIIRGREVERDGVTVALEDMGFARMEMAIKRAQDLALEGKIIETGNDALWSLLHLIETDAIIGCFPLTEAGEVVADRAYREGLVSAPVGAPRLRIPATPVTVTEKGRAWMRLPKAKRDRAPKIGV
jgi:hypothetical protein